MKEITVTLRLNNKHLREINKAVKLPLHIDERRFNRGDLLSEIIAAWFDIENSPDDCELRDFVTWYPTRVK